MFPAKSHSIEKEKTWTEEEDEKLRILVILKREKNWERIAKELVGKTPSQCKQRWKTSLSPSIIKVTERRKWVPEEDEKLSTLVDKYGTKNWRIISSHLRGRLPKQCRERWINHLDPSIVKGRLTEKEWKVVLDAHEDLGNRWSEIAKLLPGRTPNQIKNHWHAMLRKTTKRKQREFSNDGDDLTSYSIENGEGEEKSNEDPSPPLSPPKSPQPPISPISPISTVIENTKFIEEEEELRPKKKFKSNDYQPVVDSKLEALVKIAEFMYQFEVNLPPSNNVKSNPSNISSIITPTQQLTRSNGTDECSPNVLNISSIITTDSSIDYSTPTVYHRNKIQIQELVQGVSPLNATSKSSKKVPTSLSSPLTERRVSNFTPNPTVNNSTTNQSNQLYDRFGGSAFKRVSNDNEINISNKLHAPNGIKGKKKPFQSIWNSN